ncbi:complexin-3-like [Zootoca vivipara]|uniref:complexin-3-like n=1 Tax=Zootoca vivipara TaxID=8524 RepID=UPI0015925097|nr:complexin-3-like [Zootoca vivipara]
MESAVKSAFGVPARQLLCCVSADFPREKDISSQRCHKNRAQPPARKKPINEKQKSKRDAAFAQQKAERASMRAHLRQKYQLPKNRSDKKQLEAVGSKTKLPRDLLAIVNPKAATDPSSIFSSFGGLDFSALRVTAASAVQSLQRPVQCPVM